MKWLTILLASVAVVGVLCYAAYGFLIATGPRM